MIGRLLAGAYRDLVVAGPREMAWQVRARLARATGLTERLERAPADYAAVAAQALAPAFRNAAAWHAHLKSRKTPQFLFLADDRARLRDALAAVPPDPRLAPLLNGGRLFYGRPLEPDAAKAGWSVDPVTGVAWPAAGHWSKISLSAPAPGADVRNVWELGRLRDLYVLGRGYWRTGDERCARRAAALVRSWLDANPPEQGIHWASSLEVGLRAVALIWALNWFVDAPSFDADLVWRMTGALEQSAIHLDRHLAFSRACTPGNHVIGEVVGLAAISLVFPEFRRSADRWHRASRLVASEAAHQVCADGVHFEEAPGYHAFVAELLVFCERLAERNGQSISGVEAAARSMASALTSLTGGHSRWPCSGDDDEAVGYDLHPPEISRTQALANLLQPAPAALASPAGEDALWFGRADAGAEAATRVTADEPVVVNRFGVTVHRGRDRLFVRGGSQSRHTHADALHVDLVLDGVPELIDTGTLTYNSSAADRGRARSTKAHNTVVVDDMDQARQHRTFRCTSPLSVSWRRHERGRDWYLVDGEHSGYARLGIRHRRQVVWVDGCAPVVIDSVAGDGVHKVAVHWHFDHVDTAVLVASDRPVSVTMSDAWISPFFGVKGIAHEWRGEVTDELPVRVASTIASTRGRICWTALSVDADGSVRLEPGSRCIQFDAQGSVVGVTGE
jgi:hypothetical protein